MAAPFTLRYRADLKQWSVRFTLDGRRVERKIAGPTRKRDRPEAMKAARELYSRYVNGQEALPPKRELETPAHDLAELAVLWVRALAVRPVTRDLYRKYARYWVRQWATLDELTEPVLKLYAQKRLKEVRGKSVRNELSALAKFFEWCIASGYLATAPAIPKVSLAEGTPDARRRHRTAAPSLSAAEGLALIDALPERSPRGGWPIRARAIVAFTTSLRPTTLDKLRAPEHYSPGSRTLRITADIDKEGFDREIPLAPAARAALDSVCPERGPIFGRHRLDPYAQTAAQKVLPPSKAAVFCMQHLRSAALTHILELSSNLPGAQYLAGHKHASTTARYIRPTARAARDALAAVFGEAEVGKEGDDRAK